MSDHKYPPDAGAGTGTVTSVATTAPITGGTITGTGTIAVSDFVASGASHARGAVPDPGSTAGTYKFLREDATWVAQPLYAVSSASTITGQSLADISGLSIALPAAGTYIFEMQISGTSSSTAGCQFGLNYTGSVTSVAACQIGQLSTTTWAATALITANNTASTVLMTTASAECSVLIRGQIVVSNTGNLTMRGLKVTSGTLTYRANGWMWAHKVT